MDLPVKRRRRVRVKPETTPETTPEVTPEVIQDVEDFDGPGLLSLPTEILIEILSYLDYTDSYSLECVSKRFELAQTPWRDYEVMANSPPTPEVIHQLKRMPHLLVITIMGRSDCNQILRQLSLSNKKLQKLYIKRCRDSVEKIYLRPRYLTRILERCSNLHTISIKGFQHRGTKFYQLLGNKGIQLRSLKCIASPLQFRIFSKYSQHIGVDDRVTMSNMCVGCQYWSPLRYFLADDNRGSVDKRYTANVSYFRTKQFFTVNV